MAKDLRKMYVVDLEATCWDKPEDNPKNQPNEIIEIGITEVNLKTMSIIGTEGILIKPQFSEISKFCTQLTTITPEMVENAISYPQALEYLNSKYKLQSFTWGSYGDYDRVQLGRNDELYKVKNQFGRTHWNIKNLFAIKNKLSREVGMDKALAILNLPLDGTHHRADSDSFNISKILITTLK